jgi:hypothetical protein
LWAAGILDADAVATLVAWRGQAGIADLEGMTAEAIEHFRATLGGDEAPLITLFAEELLRLGVITPADLERGGPRAGAGSDDGA